MKLCQITRVVKFHRIAHPPGNVSGLQGGMSTVWCFDHGVGASVRHGVGGSDEEMQLLRLQLLWECQKLDPVLISLQSVCAH